MRIAFAGTPAFAATALEALLEAGHEVALVLSQPDRPAGRGRLVQPGPVKRLARDRGIPVLCPASLRRERGGAETAEALDALRDARTDMLVVAAYGLLLPGEVLRMPAGFPVDAARAAALNIHASLLPRWRGAAPVARAIEAGDASTGITIMQMDEGLDTGPILMAESLAIGPDASTGMLTDVLAGIGARLIVSALHEIAAGSLHARPQADQGVAYARKLEKGEAWIDWRESAGRLALRLRAFDPFPGACSIVDGHTVKCWRGEALDDAQRDAQDGAAPGTTLAADAQGVEVACGQGRLRLTQLQRAGGRRMDARAFLAGMPIAAGARWSLPVPPDLPRDPGRSGQ